MARKARIKPDVWPKRYFFHFFSLLLIILTAFYVLQYYYGQIDIQTANYNTSMTISLMFSILVFSYLIIRGNTLADAIRILGLSREKLTLGAVSNGLKLFLLVIFLEIVVSIISQITNTQLPSNVTGVLAAAPLYFLVFATLVSPINEEIFFRGFLVPRIGIFFSALIFAILHAGYGSLSEFAAAFIFGLAAGYIFKKYKSLYATIIGHFAVNLLTVVAFLFLGGAG